MKGFFQPNLDRRGRWMRAGLGVLLCGGGVWAGLHIWWFGGLLILSGGFVLFEAVRGWCVMRACGIRTRV